MTAGYRSLTAIWIGGLSAAPGGAGYRGPVAPWLGGLCAPNNLQPGYRCLTGFWIGGLCAPDVVPPQPPGPTPGGGGGKKIKYKGAFHGRDMEALKRKKELQRKRNNAAIIILQ